MKLYLLPFLCIIIALSSCSSQKNSLTYFENIKGSQSGAFNSSDYEIKIAPDDELLITVTSLVPEATLAFNLPLVNPAMMETLTSQSQPQQQTYRVDREGNLEFPVLGKIHVEGLSTDKIKEILKTKITETVESPIVRVELVNFRVNVLGEVKVPGAVNVSRQRFSIFDALAQAGDLTEFGLRENILLIREQNGQKTYNRINLNDANVVSSPYYYLQQNDVIYVEPNRIKKDNSKYNQNNAFKLSVVATVVSAISVIASLVIALAIKN
ncbi:MAG: polysaccharide biosynthesis/export family protein [Muribaculaceae bacterium]|nr:polysaccharide biosynthesis/export family protein [Muribaculaceae bacterium]